MLHQGGIDSCAVVEWRVKRDGVEGRLWETRAGIVPCHLEADGAGGEDSISVRVRRLRIEPTSDRAITTPEIQQSAERTGQA